MTHKQIFNIKPRSKQRPRSTRFGHTYTPKETREYEKSIAEAYTGKLFAEGPLRITLAFNAGWTKITIEELKPKRVPSKLRGDIDNYAKAILDALNGVAYTDDKQIVSLELRKL